MWLWRHSDLFCNCGTNEESLVMDGSFWFIYLFFWFKFYCLFIMILGVLKYEANNANLQEECFKHIINKMKEMWFRNIEDYFVIEATLVSVLFFCTISILCYSFPCAWLFCLGLDIYNIPVCRCIWRALFLRYILFFILTNFIFKPEVIAFSTISLL